MPEVATVQRELTFAQAIREALAEEMRRDPSVFYIGQGIGKRGGNVSLSVCHVTLARDRW